MSKNPDALAAARNYLRLQGVNERSFPTRIKSGTKTIVTTWNQVLEETAQAIAEEGLIHVYAGTEHRSTRKRRAYREAEARSAQQNGRSEGAIPGPPAPGSPESKTAVERRTA